MFKDKYISSVFAALVAGSLSASGGSDQETITEPSYYTGDDTGLSGRLHQYEPISGTPRHHIPYEDRWLAIGRLVNKDGGVCTATLVAEDIIITADHCTEGGDLKTLDKSAFTFHIGYEVDTNDNASSRAQSSILSIDAPETSRDAELFDKDPKFSSLDIAYLKLARPLGKKYGFFNLADEELPTLKHTGFHPGYQAGYGVAYGKTMTGDLSCGFNHHILTRDKIVLNCTVTSGDSGSPLLIYSDPDNPSLSNMRIYGIVSATRKGVRGNDSGEAIPVRRFPEPDF